MATPVTRPEDFDFALPAEQIAQHPAERRGDARMLVLRDSSREHRFARELPDVLPADALVVVNDSSVVPARIHASCTEGRALGRRFELLFCAPSPAGPGARVQAWVRGAKRLRGGDLLTVDGLVLRYEGAGLVDPRARSFTIVAGELLAALEAVGEVPLPPYIRRPEGPGRGDRDRYQTVYAAHRGSVAAPTAGLHWTPELLARLDVAPITLHVGPGTFLPMDVDDVEQHRVGAERVHVSEASAARIRSAQREGRPIVAVGTTATRTLESLAADDPEGAIRSFTGSVDRVITPSHAWRVVDILVTNFHLPRSSLLMLVCSLGGRERVLAAYREAVAAGYRFYSYGDCMVVERAR